MGVQQAVNVYNLGAIHDLGMMIGTLYHLILAENAGGDYPLYYKMYNINIFMLLER